MLHFVESGNPDGKTIVYLHGSGMAAWSWNDVTEQLPQYHNIAVDLPGHGLSNEIRANSLSDMAQIVADFIAETVPGGKAHVVGLSLGGITTIEMMQHRPEVIKSAVMSGVNAMPLPFMMKMMVNVSKMVIKQDFFIRMNAKMFQLEGNAEKAYFESMKRLDMQTFNKLLPEILDYQPADNLRNVEIPALFVAGGAEDKINVESVSILADAMPDAAGVLAPDVHHGWSGENPVLFADMIQQWIESKSLADGLDIKADKRRQLEMA
mgnify:CR=1 FL=1